MASAPIAAQYLPESLIESLLAPWLFCGAILPRHWGY
jgi:hypothetical protein